MLGGFLAPLVYESVQLMQKIPFSKYYIHFNMF